MFNNPAARNTSPTVKERLDVKLINVPPTKEIVAESIRDLGPKHLNKLIIIFGTAVRTGKVNNRELKKKFACKNCGKEYICESDLTESNRFVTPITCDGQVEKKENPFFAAAANMMKNRGRGGGRGSGTSAAAEPCRRGARRLRP